MHKLKDIKSKLGGSRKILFTKLKNGIIKASEIENSIYFHEIRERVELVCYLELILQNGFILHKNHRNGIIKYTRIDFDYLIKTEYRNKVVNIFLKKDSQGKFHVCNSIFYQSVNYVKNQRPLAILKFQLEKRSI